MNKGYLILMFSILTILIAPVQSFAEDGHDHGSELHDKASEREDHEGHGHDQKGHDEHGHEEEGEHQEENSLVVDEEARQMIGLETVVTEHRTFGDRLKVYGKIAKDTDQYSHITFPEGGVVKTVHTKLGDIVDAGTELFAITKADGTQEKVLSPGHGSVISIYIAEGDKVDRLKPLVSIVNLDTLRTTIDIYEKDLSFVKIGQPVELMSIAYPDKVFHGKVVFISPEIDDESKSIKVRVDVDNSEHLLKLGMSISGELIYHTDRESLVVPRSAIQQLNGEDVVFVPSHEDEIEIREVLLGHAFGDAVEVKSGLREGEKVVTRGSFNLKSEREKGAFGDGHAH